MQPSPSAAAACCFWLLCGIGSVNGRRIEYVFLCHDDFDPDVDIDPKDYLTMLEDMTYDQLIEETETDDIFTLDEFMSAWG